MKKLLLLMLITPLIGFGQYVFNTKADLQTAVDLYVEDKNNAISNYGEINTWDVSNISDMSALFFDKSTFNENIADWDTSNVNDMSRMFSRASSFNQDISNWDTSSVTNMEEMFAWTSFNRDISSWDVSNVESFFRTFAYTTAFNQPIGSWDVSSAVTISGMFRGSNDQTRTVFNQDISSWNTSNVINMSEVFAYADFNQDIGDWDISNVRLLTAMFTYNPYFNQDIGEWDLSSMTDANNLINGLNYGDAEGRMGGVFRNATSFNQDLSGWCVTDVTSEPYKFSDSSALTNTNKPVWGTCPISVSAGDDLNVCDDEVVQITGASASNYVSLYWSSNGDGSFVNVSSLNPTYYPGSNDISNGNVIITLIAVYSNNEQVEDTMIVNISQSPCGENRKINLNGPVYITEADGLILKSAENGKCYRLKIIAESLLLVEVNCE
jgi:surface protein